MKGLFVADCNMVNFSLSPRIERRCLQLFPSIKVWQMEVNISSSYPTSSWDMMGPACQTRHRRATPGQVAGGTSPVHLAVRIIPVEQKCWVFVVVVLWDKVVPLEHRPKQWLWICWRSFYLLFTMYIFHSGNMFFVHQLQKFLYKYIYC